MKSYKKLLGVLCSFLVLALLCACGKATKPVKTQEITPETTLAPETTETVTEPEPTYDDSILSAEGTVYEPVSGRLGEGVGGTLDGCVFKVSFVGAEFFRAEGEEMVRLYYDVENCASWIIPSSDVKVIAAQDGEYLWNDLDGHFSTEAHLAHADMRPGTKARLAAEYNCSWEGGPIYAEASYFITFGDYYLNALVYPEDGQTPAEIVPGLYDDSLVAVFQPAEMPCKPASEDPRKAVTAPDLGGLPEVADLKMGSKGTMKINDAVVINAKDGGKAIEIHATYTNRSGEAESYIGAGYEIRVMQDGLELWWDGDPYEIYDDEAMNKRLADGESVELTFRYCLFTDTPVTVEFCEWADSDAKCGKVFPVLR